MEDPPIHLMEVFLEFSGTHVKLAKASFVSSKKKNLLLFYFLFTLPDKNYWIRADLHSKFESDTLFFAMMKWFFCLRKPRLAPDTSSSGRVQASSDK